MRLVFIGDVGGHFDELYSALVELGMHPKTLELPRDVHVVQVGDLVHRGPQSPAVLRLVKRLLASGQWTQVLGNHEALYLGLAAFQWNESLDQTGEDLLKSWWENGLMVGAAAFDTQELGPLLVTHAGLTRGLWRELGQPENAQRAAEVINASKSDARLWRPGLMMGGKTNHKAGIIWAEAGRELLRSWQERGPVPFSQVHGHSSICWWDRKLLLIDPSPSSFQADVEARHFKVEVEGKSLVGIDPGFSETSRRWKPLILTGEKTA